MTIYHPISDFLFELFPDAMGKGTDALVEAIRKFYSLGDFVPDVVEVNGIIEVRVGADKMHTDARQFQRAVGLCEKGQYDEAKPILETLAQRNPTNSEVHRILGQIASERGDQDAAIDYLIDALRWDPNNGYALTMMGNIWAKYRDDIDTASKYFNQALVVDPKDHVAANNIGTNLLQLGRFVDAEKYFDQALALNGNYPNTHYGLSVVYAHRRDLDRAFASAIEALKKNKTKDKLWENSVKQARVLATDLIALHCGDATVEQFAQQLTERSGKPVRFERDSDIPTTAKLEVAENYDRAYHLVRYKPDHAEVQHLRMHELEHLRLITEAREEKVNKLFVMRKEQRVEFIRSMDKHIQRLDKLGYETDSIGSYVAALVDGINRQVYNAPIDLFIEQRLYTEYPAIRPYQFLSLMQLLSEAISAVTAPRILELTPPPLLSKSRAYNLLLARQFAELFGIDRTSEFHATPTEKAQAQKFWSEFLEYRADRQPGEEYELVQHWADDLGLSSYFSLVDEETFRAEKSDTLAEQVTKIEADPLDEFTHDPQKVQEMRTFQDTATEQGLNTAVVMFMVDALQHFKGMPLPKIKEVALEIAMLGTQGIKPDHQGYHLHHVPGKTFSGHHLLAYYYVSWKLAIPEMVEQLHLPYDGEYGMAVQLDEGLK